MRFPVSLYIRKKYFLVTFVFTVQWLYVCFVFKPDVLICTCLGLYSRILNTVPAVEAPDHITSLDLLVGRSTLN